MKSSPSNKCPQDDIPVKVCMCVCVRGILCAIDAMLRHESSVTVIFITYYALVVVILYNFNDITYIR